MLFIHKYRCFIIASAVLSGHCDWLRFGYLVTTTGYYIMF